MGLTLTRLCSCVPCGWETHFWGCFFFFFSFCGLGQVSGSGPLSVFLGRSLLWTQTCCVQTALPDDTEQGIVLYLHSHYGITQQKLNIQVNSSRVFYLILMIIIEENRDWDVWQPLKKFTSIIVAVWCGRTAPSSCCVKMIQHICRRLWPTV